MARYAYPVFFSVVALCILLVLVSFRLVFGQPESDIASASDATIHSLAEDPRLVDHTPTRQLALDEGDEDSADSDRQRKQCTNTCKHGLDIVRSFALVGDEYYPSMLTQMDKLATYLAKNPEVRTELIDIALSTTDGNKRALIMAAFSHLNPVHRRELGIAMSQSSFREQRREGINFLSYPETMDRSIALDFVEMLAVEEDRHVQEALIKALSVPEKFRGDQEIVEGLSYVVETELDSVARGEALLAAVNLTEDAEFMMGDTLSAIRAIDEDYRVYGLQALESIIGRRAEEGLSMSWRNQETADDVFAEILSPDFGEVPELVLNEAYATYNRIF